MAATTTSEESLELVRTSTEAVFNDRQYDRVTEFQSPDIVLHGPMPGQELHGTEAGMENLKLFHAAFPDLEAIEELAFSDGEYVCSYYSYRGTHEGDLLGIPATGVEAEVSGISIDRVEDGAIVESWTLVDFMSLFEQLGVLPPREDLSD